MIGSTEIAYWAWFGTISLLILTYQDFKPKKKGAAPGMMIDDRKNIFMMGVTLSLISHIFRPFWYILILFGIVILLSVFLNKFKAVGSGDVNALAWIFYGLGLINPYKLGWFVVMFIVLTLLFHGIKYIICKFGELDHKKPVPFFSVILINFVFNMWFMGLY